MTRATTSAETGQASITATVASGATDVDHSNNTTTLQLEVLRPLLRQVQSLRDGEGGLAIGGLSGGAISPDGAHLYVGSYNFGGVKMWNLDTEELTVIDDELGGVDGVLTDVCGNVYVTQYGNGLVWRIAPDLTKEIVADLETNWIPNLNFGSGVGGWEHDRIYISDREADRVFELDPGVWGIAQPQL